MNAIEIRKIQEGGKRPVLKPGHVDAAGETLHVLVPQRESLLISQCGIQIPGIELRLMHSRAHFALNVKILTFCIDYAHV